MTCTASECNDYLKGKRRRGSEDPPHCLTDWGGSRLYRAGKRYEGRKKKTRLRYVLGSSEEGGEQIVSDTGGCIVNTSLGRSRREEDKKSRRV